MKMKKGFSCSVTEMAIKEKKIKLHKRAKTSADWASAYFQSEWQAIPQKPNKQKRWYVLEL